MMIDLTPNSLKYSESHISIMTADASLMHAKSSLPNSFFDLIIETLNLNLSSLPADETLDGLKVDFEVLDPELEMDEEEEGDEEEEEEFALEEETLWDEPILECIQVESIQKLTDVAEPAHDRECLEHLEKWTTEMHEVHFKIIREEAPDGRVTLKTIDAAGNEHLLDPRIDFVSYNQQGNW